MACKSPWMCDTKTGKVPVACGHCPDCKRRKVNDWVFRLEQEDKKAESSLFVTLTYDTENVPLVSNGMSLSPMEYRNGSKTKSNDLTRFFKKLRKRGEKFRYYAVGEYGNKTNRPHYHVIFFNIKDDNNIIKAWNLGSVHIGTVTNNSISYTLKYIMKEKKIPAYQGDMRVREFTRMSKKLGKCYIEPKYRIDTKTWKVNVYDKINNFYKGNITRNFLRNEKGYKIAMPKYYRDHFLDDKEKARQRIIIQNEIDKAEKKAEQSHNDKRYDYTTKKALKEQAEWNKFLYNNKKSDLL